MNRATNAALVCGLILAFAVLLAREREYASLLCSAGTVLFGAAVFILPWCLYLRSIGALDEFFYAAFTHNFHYAANGTASKSLTLWLIIAAKTSMVPLSVVFAVLLLRKKLLSFRVVLPVICMGFVGAWTMTMGYGLKNYYLNIVPVLLLDVCLGMVLIGNLERVPQGKKAWAILALCAVCFLPYAPGFVRHGGRIIYYDILGYPDAEGRKQEGKLLSSLIQEDRDSVWGYDLNPRDYLYADLMPCYRCFTQQTWMSEAEPQILWEIDQMLASDPPVWVLVSRKGPEEFSDRLTGVFEYEFVGTADGSGTRVYHRSDEQALPLLKERGRRK